MNSILPNTRLQALLFYLAFCTIFVFSFILYSPYGSIRFASDQTMHVLMTHDLKLPDDLYYWGQDRLGSMVPIAARPLYLLGIDAKLAATIIHWGFILGTALLVLRYFKNYFSKLLFLLIWLLPLPEFKENLTVGHPYAPQFFLLLLGLYLHERKPVSFAVRALLFFWGNLAMFFSCWISELSLCFIGTYYGLLGLRFFVNRKTIKTDLRLLLLNTATTLTAIALAGSFIAYARDHAMKFPGYYGTFFAETKAWGDGIARHWNDFTGIIQQISIAPFKGLYALIFVLIVLLLAFLLLRQKLKPVLSFYPLLFLFTGIGSWILLYLLYWTRFNDYDYKYWTFPVLFLLIALLMAAERIKRGRAILVAAICLLTFFQMPITYHYATDKTDKRWDVDFCHSELQEFKQLGSCGLIADYWFAYSLAGANPDSITSVTHDQCYLRTPRRVKEVFEKKTIYLVKNRWLDEWPEVITQYGHRLVRSGAPFRIERASFCRYRIENHR